MGESSSPCIFMEPLYYKPFSLPTKKSSPRGQERTRMDVILLEAREKCLDEKAGAENK